jgi:hypothetical protein
MKFDVFGALADESECELADVQGLRNENNLHIFLRLIDDGVVEV